VKTLDPSEIRIGQRIRVTVKSFPDGPLVEHTMVYEGVVQGVEDREGRPSIVTFTEPMFQGGNGALLTPHGGVSEITVEALPYLTDTIVRATATTYGTKEDPNADATVETSLWIKDAWSGWKVISAKGYSYARVHDAELESGQTIFDVHEVIYTPKAETD
jgi:hypothetical protein